MPRRPMRTSLSSSKRRPRNQRNSAPQFVRLELDAKALADSIAGRQAILPSLPNMQDNLAVQTLSTSKIGDLPVDQFGRLFCRDGTSPLESHVIALRLALIGVYFAAANMRLYARATRGQLKAAQAALTALTNATQKLDQIRPPNQRGLKAAFGSPMDDLKGRDELNDFGARCSKIRMDMVPVMIALSRTIENETAKPRLSMAGDRKRRLRTLVEALADSWKSKVGKPLAPYVYAKRLGKGVPAFVVGRKGDFIELAKALFSSVDEFAESEVISAVTNVHESGLATTNQQITK